MATSDTVFAGSIPQLYEQNLVPLLFQPWAEDLAERAAALVPPPHEILETAAGTGVVTRALAERLPDAVIVATDLNPDMLALAEARTEATNAAFRQADAQALPFDDSCFDLVACQFGVMFFPDRTGAYREARRVLRDGGRFLFNAWGRLDDNPASRMVHESVAALFPQDPPQFLARTPFGYHDTRQIEAELREAGFTEVAIDSPVYPNGRVAPEAVAIGLIRGSPLFAEVSRFGEEAIERAIAAAIAALAPLAGNDGRIDSTMVAHVVTAA